MTVRGLLLIGYGNPGRGDDGLGPAFAQAIADEFPRLAVDIDYQLTVDHAALIAAHDAVIFADAALGLTQAYDFAPITAEPMGLGSHQVTPQAALALSGLLFGHSPQAWTLGIAGTEFGRVHEGLSPDAAANLTAALTFLRGWIADQTETSARSASRAKSALEPDSDTAPRRST